MTLSENADVDLFENGARIQAGEMARAPKCPGVKVGARFALAPGDLVLLQISNAPDPMIRASFAEIQP